MSFLLFYGTSQCLFAGLFAIYLPFAYVVVAVQSLEQATLFLIVPFLAKGVT